MRTDREIIDEIRQNCRQISWLRPFLGSVHIKIQNGSVIVEGRVPADSLRGLILRLVGSTSGVKEVIDHLAVEEIHDRVGVQIDWAQQRMALT